MSSNCLQILPQFIWFHVFLLKKYIGDPAVVVPIQNFDGQDSLSYEEIPVKILDYQIRRLRNEEVPLVKVIWRNQSVEGATWEVESDMHTKYRQLVLRQPRSSSRWYFCPNLTSDKEVMDILLGTVRNAQVMDYPDDVSHPRMFRCLAAKCNTKIKEADLFNLLNDVVRLLQVVHPWIVPTEEELLMTSYITLGHVDTIANPTVELIRKELDGETAIRRAFRQGQSNVEALHDQPTKADPGASSGRVIGVGVRHTDATTTHDDEHVDAQENINMFENTPF
ncbi:putative U4/U6 small nuclear ribonucleoprotein Prp3-like [Capsicum annuum]|nr:putative U4/U6 small nuclear ribonucleoprotein Prp3-like [Capsicum annuum]